MSDDSQKPVTVVVTRVVRPNKEDEFARWADEVDSAAARFDGHLGGVRLHDAQGMNHLIYQFDSEEHLKAWEASPRRRELLREGDQYSKPERSTSQGLHTWFDIPGSSVSQRWKNFLLTWAAAYPILLVLNLGLTALVPQLPRPLSLGITSGILTAVLTWVVLPKLTRRARPWLLHGAKPDPAERPDQ